MANRTARVTSQAALNAVRVLTRPTVFNTSISPTGIAKQAADTAGRVQSKPRLPGRSPKDLQTFPKAPKLTGGTGPVGTPGGPKKLTGALKPSPLAKRIGRNFATYLSHGPPQDKKSRLPGQTSSGVTHVGPLTLASADPNKAPIVKTLDIVGRPYHTVSGAINAGLQGKNVAHAALQNLVGKQHTSGSDILKTVGVKSKLVRAIGGFGLDVALDPLSHGRAEVAEVAPKAAARTAAKTTRQIAKAEARVAVKRTPKRVLKVTKLKARAQQEAAAPTRGLRVGPTVRVPFKEKPLIHLRTSGRATAAAARKVKQAPGAKATGGKVRDVLHETVAPAVTPSYRTVGQHKTIRVAQARQRAAQASAERATARQVQAFRKAVPRKADQMAVIHAIESQTIHELPTHLQQVARSYEKTHAAQLAEKVRTNLLAGGLRPTENVRGYFPHVNKKALDKKGEPTFIGDTKPAAEHARTIDAPLAEANAQHPGLFIEQPHVAFGIKAANTARQTSRADLWQRVAETGRPFGKDAHMPDLQHEVVYKVGPRGLDAVEQGGYPDLNRIHKIAQGGEQGKFVVLDRRSVQDVQATTSNARASTVAGRAFDKTQGKLKMAATVLNPGFQLRNLIGDSILAHEADTTLRSFKHALTATRAAHARNVVESSGKSITNPALAFAEKRKLRIPFTNDRTLPGVKLKSAQRLLDKKIKLGTETSTYGRELQLAEQHGAIGGGFAGSELRSQIGGLKLKTNRVIRRGQVKVKDESRISKVNSTRENLPRMATYLSARKRGMSPPDAAAYASRAHIDYGALSPLERNFLRRVFPFYTFFARNTAIQARTLLTRPGKIAAVVKALDEAAKYAGYDGYVNYVDSLPNYQQRGIPVPVKVGGKTYPVFVSPPQTDLTALTTNTQEQWQNVANRISFFKLLGELPANYSIFFQGQIQDPKAPRVPAPSGVEHLPGPLRKFLGVAKILDKRSGKMVWGWYAKVDYASRVLPQSNFGVSVLKPVQDKRGLTGPLAIGSFLSGIKVGPDRSGDNRITQAYTKLTGVQNRLGELRQQGYSAGRPNSEYRKLLQQQKQLQRNIYGLKRQRGDKVLPGVGAPPKGRGRSPGGGGFGPGGGGGSGGFGPAGGGGGGFGPGGAEGAPGPISNRRFSRWAADVLATSAPKKLPVPGSRPPAVIVKRRLFAHPQRPGTGKFGAAQLALATKNAPLTGTRSPLQKKLAHLMWSQGYSQKQITSALSAPRGKLKVTVKKFGKPADLAWAKKQLKGVKPAAPIAQNKSHYSPAEISKMFQAYGAPKWVADALGRTSVPESGGNTHATSNSAGGGSRGLLQINPAAWPVNPQKLYNPDYNIRSALYVLSKQGSSAWSGSGTWRGPAVPAGQFNFPHPDKQAAVKARRLTPKQRRALKITRRVEKVTGVKVSPFLAANAPSGVPTGTPSAVPTFPASTAGPSRSGGGAASGGSSKAGTGTANATGAPTLDPALTALLLQFLTATPKVRSADPLVQARHSQSDSSRLLYALSGGIR